MSKILTIKDDFPTRPNNLHKEATGQPLRFMPNDVKDATIFARSSKRREFGYYCVSKQGNKFFLRLKNVDTYFTIAFADGFDPEEINRVAEDLNVPITIKKFEGLWFKGFNNKRMFHNVCFTNAIDRKKVLNVFKNTVWCDSANIYNLRDILHLKAEKLRNGEHYGIRFEDQKDTVTLYKCLSYMELFLKHPNELADAVKYITMQNNGKYVNLDLIKSKRTKIADAKNADAKKKAIAEANALIENYDLKNALYKLFMILEEPYDFDTTVEDLINIKITVKDDVYFIGNDDTSHLYRVAGRDHIMNTANWNEITDYTVVNDPEYHIPVISVDISNVMPVEESAADKSVNMTWDIETRPLSMETNPDPKNFKDKIFAICCTFHHINNPKPFCKVGIMWKKCSPTDCLDYLITCSNEQEVIIAFAKLVKSMRPDFMSDFNGCLFDQPFVVERMKLYKLTKHLASMSCEKPSYRFQKDPTNISEYYKKMTVKMEAGFNNQVDLLDIPGIIPIDVRVVFRKLYKTSDQTSLNFFLKDNKLELKEDLPYKEMFAIWDRGNPEELPEILKYCVVDAQRCQELLVKKNIIINDRAKATKSGDALYGCIHYADGVKVRNVLVTLNKPYSLAEHNVQATYPYVFACAYTHNEKGGYKGATVLQPIVGYYEIPVTALDYASLYPNCAIAKNISPDCKIIDLVLKERMEKDGHRFYEAEPGVWFIQHNTDINKMGVFSRSLSILFNERLTLKNQLAAIANCLEFLDTGINTGNYVNQEKFEAVISPELRAYIVKHKADDITDEEMVLYKECLETLRYDMVQLDAKQLAAKIFMNTFYGESGNSSSPLYDKHISATITSIGRDMLLFAKTHMEAKGWKVMYGDSVTGDTPVLCRFNGIITYYTIDSLPTKNEVFADGKILSNTQENLEVWTEKGFTPIIRIIKHKTDKKLYRITTHTGCVKVTEDHSLLDSNAEKIRPCDVKIGSELLHADLPVIASRYDIVKFGTYRFDNQLDAAKFCINIANRYHFSISTLPAYTITVGPRSVKDSDKIKRIEELPYTDDYVYDLETENHHFSAGIGRMIVHNTDSVYCLTPRNLLQDIIDNWEESKKLLIEKSKKKPVYLTKQAYWEDLVVRAIEVSKKAAKELNAAIAEYDHGQTYLNMAYEEVLMPSLFIRRKNYGGLAHQALPMFNKGHRHVFVRGFRFKKRGVSQFCKMITKNMTYDKFFEPESKMEGDQVPWNIVHELMKTIFEKKWNIDDFAKTYTYKGPTRNGVATDIVKKNTEKYGVKVDPGDKYPAVVVTGVEEYDIYGRKNNLKISDITVLLDVAKKHNMKIDVMYYMDKEVKNLLGQYLSIYPVFRKPTEYFVEMIKEREKQGKLKKDFNIEVSTAESDYASNAANSYVEYLLQKYSAQSQITHGVPKKAYKTAQSFFKTKKISVLSIKSDIREKVNYAELFKKDLSTLKKELLEMNAESLTELQLLDENQVSEEDIQKCIEEVTMDIRDKIKHCTYSDDALEIIAAYTLDAKYEKISNAITRREELRITMEQIAKMLVMVNKKLSNTNVKTKVYSKGMNLA